MNPAHSLLKGKMALLVLLCWLLALPAMALPRVARQVGESLTQTCDSIVLLDGAYLQATCKDCSSSTGNTRYNYLMLDMCVGVDAISNELNWELYGKFSAYCSDCHLNAGYTTNMTCSCQSTGNRDPAKNTTLVLDEGIKNKNGTLSCRGAQGNKI